jgi:hypothetical protein
MGASLVEILAGKGAKRADESCFIRRSAARGKTSEHFRRLKLAGPIFNGSGETRYGLFTDTRVRGVSETAAVPRSVAFVLVSIAHDAPSARRQKLAE